MRMPVQCLTYTEENKYLYQRISRMIKIILQSLINLLSRVKKKRYLRDFSTGASLFAMSCQKLEERSRTSEAVFCPLNSESEAH